MRINLFLPFKLHEVKKINIAQGYKKKRLQLAKYHVSVISSSSFDYRVYLQKFILPVLSSDWIESQKRHLIVFSYAPLSLQLAKQCWLATYARECESEQSRSRWGSKLSLTTSKPGQCTLSALYIINLRSHSVCVFDTHGEKERQRTRSAVCEFPATQMRLI